MKYPTYENKQKEATTELYEFINSDPFFVQEFRTIYLSDGQQEAFYHLAKVAEYKQIDNRQDVDYMALVVRIYEETN